MSQEQLSTYLVTAVGFWPFAGLALGVGITLLSGMRRLLVGQAAGVVLTAVSIGVLIARL